jgi:hypothetical protein
MIYRNCEDMIHRYCRGIMNMIYRYCEDMIYRYCRGITNMIYRYCEDLQDSAVGISDSMEITPRRAD